jgi:hypothetical protein
VAKKTTRERLKSRKELARNSDSKSTSKQIEDGAKAVGKVVIKKLCELEWKEFKETGIIID